MPVPVSRWQVPQKWSRTMPLSTVSLAYGVLLGFGVLTRIPASTFVVVLLWVAYLGSAPVGALVLGVYGVSRALPVTALSFGGFSSGETVVIAYKLAAWQPVMHMLNGLILAFATGWLVGGSVF